MIKSYSSAVLSYLVALLLVLGLLTDLSAKESTPQVKTSSLERKLETIKVEKILYKEAKLKDVIKDLSRLSRELDPGKKGINIIIQNVDESKIPPITMDLHSVTLLDVLRFTTQGMGVQYRIEHEALVIFDEPEPAIP